MVSQPASLHPYPSATSIAMSICLSGHLKCCSHPIWPLSSTYSLSLSSKGEHWQVISTFNFITLSLHITGMICFRSFKGWGFPDSSVVKNPPANSGHVGSIPRLGRYPGEGNGNPPQYPCLGNPMGRGAWQATVHGVAQGQTQLNRSTYYYYQ